MAYQTSHLDDDQLADLARGTLVDANLEGHLGQCMACKARLGGSLLVKGLLAALPAAALADHLSAESLDSLHAALFEGEEVASHELVRQCAHISRCDECFTLFFNLHVEVTPGTAAVERAERVIARTRRYEPVGALTISLALGTARVQFSRALSVAPKVFADVLLSAMSMRDTRKRSPVTSWSKVKAAPGVARAASAPTVNYVPAASQLDFGIAASHDYLLSRSASRSEEPKMVGGIRLPTESELLKMADADYMNERQLAFFKYRLKQMEGELLANANEATKKQRGTEDVADLTERDSIEEEHALALRTWGHERKLLEKVRQALIRIEGGGYGYCEATGEPIGIPRLLARPTATLSLEALQRRESEEHSSADIALQELNVAPERAPSDLEEFDIEGAALRLGVRIVWESGNTSLEVRVTDRESGAPRRSAFLSVVGPRQRRLSSAVTTSDGTATLALPPRSKLLRVRTTRTGKAWDISLALSD